jgi:hypothetical protein
MKLDFMSVYTIMDMNPWPPFSHAYEPEGRQKRGRLILFFWYVCETTYSQRILTPKLAILYLRDQSQRLVISSLSWLLSPLVLSQDPLNVCEVLHTCEQVPPVGMNLGH